MRRTARERSDQAGEDLGRGCPPPSGGKVLHLEPEKIVSDAYLGLRLLEYDFLQIARRQEDNIEL